MNKQAIPAPFEDRLTVQAEWLDPNGHMNVAFYLRAVDDGSNAFFDDIGLGWGYTQGGVGSIFVTGCNVDFRQELFAGNRLRVTTQLIDASHKLIHCYAELFNEDDGYLAATCETLYMHIAFATRRSAPIPTSAQQRLTQILSAHQALLGTPATLGRSLGIRR